MRFKVGCSPLTSTLYAGNVLKNGMWGAKKYDVTDSAVSAVAQLLFQTDSELHFKHKSKSYILRIIEVERLNPKI